MEISNYYVPVALILPVIAILGILFVTLGMSFVLRRRRSRERPPTGERRKDEGQDSS
ncbi:hypothetical protein [Lentisalinibacter orientalis]|uniref:hypothetical protein n=1 Tax=Lentisalinibacter orientalis TaxID=2992241 RepID=UPI0038697120